MKFVLLSGRLLKEQAVASRESVRAQLPLEICPAGSVSSRIVCCGQNFEPDRVLTEAAQPEHPLQGDGEIPTSFQIFGCESAPDEDRHGGSSSGTLVRQSLLRDL